jgi:ubiquinone biosynthesis protein COQ9
MAPNKKLAEKKATAKKTASKKAPGKSTKPQGDLNVITEAALTLAAEDGWTSISMTAIAIRSGVPLGDVLLFAPTRAHLLARLIDRLDAANLAGVNAVDEADSTRDRLFEVLMRRFDLLNQNRAAVQAVIAGIPRDPSAAAMLACRIGRSAAALLGAAGISADGLMGFARVQGLKAVMAYALRAWMTDDNADMAKTMAALDRALNRAERFSNIRKWRRPADATTPAESH